MPNWKKIIVSGSDAVLTSVIATAGFTGSLLGTASFASTASFITASGVYGPYGSNSVISASYALNALSASYALTASFVQNAVSASYALNGGVTQLLAGPNVTLSPTNGLGQVTVSATLSGSTIFNTATGSYGSFYDTTTQTNPVANIARSMSFNSTDITNGVSISGSTSPFNTYIKTTNAGVYDIQFSAQVDKTDGGTDDIVIWLRKNGIDLTDTATTLTLPTNNSKVVAAWNWFVTSAANDYYQIIWRSADTDLRLLAEPISVDHPGIPSVIATVNRVDQFLSNTGSFSGSFTGEFTGSLQGTSSWANNAITASYALNALSASYSTNALSASFATSASQAVNATTASFATSTAAVAGTINYIPKFATATTLGNSQIFESGSNIGIGTTTPTEKLEVNGNALIKTSFVGTVNAFGDNYASFSHKARAGTNDYSILSDNVGTTYLNASSSQNIKFRIDNIDKAILDSSGNFGIGTTTPTLGNLQVNGNVYATSFTGSLLGTASYATQALSSSYALTASFITASGVYGPYGSNSVISASYALNALSASYAQTASYVQNAVSASYASTASYVLNAVSSSFATSASFASTVPASGVIGLNLSQIATASFTASVSPTQFTVTSASITEFTVTGTGVTIGNATTDTHRVTGSLNISGSTNINGNTQITGSLAVTQNITGSRMFLSSSNGTISGSTLTVYGSGSTLPVFTVQGSQGELFSITDSLSGSLFSVNDISGLPIMEVFSDNTTLIGSYLDPMLITTTKVTQTNSGSFVVYSLPTASYDTAFFEYSIKSGSNARAGTIMAIQSGTSVNFTETTTTDIGNTTAVSFTVLVSGSNLALTGSSTTGSWTIKSIVRGI